jgi:hypothetical protein
MQIVFSLQQWFKSEQRFSLDAIYQAKVASLKILFSENHTIGQVFVCICRGAFPKPRPVPGTEAKYKN